MTALEKAESALHRSGSVMDTGAACPPDFRPWPRDLGPLVTHPQSAGHRRCGGHRRGARGRPRRRPQTGDTGHGVPSRRRVAAGDHHGRGTGCAGAGFTSRRDRRPDAGQPRHRVDAPPRGAAALQRRVRRGCPQQRRRLGSGPAVHRRRATTTRSSPSASCATRRGPSSRGTGFRKFPWCRRIHPTGRPACRDAASGRSISVALDPHRGSKHPQTCCRAIQIADVAGEQFGAAYRTPGLGLCLQHHHSPAASASIAAATNQLRGLSCSAAVFAHDSYYVNLTP